MRLVSAIRRMLGLSAGGFNITLRQTGGFAGLTREVTLDSRELAEDERGKLSGLIAQSGVFTVVVETTAPFPDGLNYELIVDGDAGRKSLSFHTGNCPKELLQLVDFLNERASYS